MKMWWSVSLAVLGMLMMWPASRAHAFCGMYVSGASDKLYNDATQVVMMREGTKTVLSMRNTYQGPPKDFAMVIPVPVVLQREHVKVLKDELFQKIDTLAAPRLVEYWEQEPCPSAQRPSKVKGAPIDSLLGGLDLGVGVGALSSPSVKIEAKFKAGEYEIVVLSATESNALEQWLLANKYNIPKGSASVLAGYVQKGMYFFVAKVDVDKVKFNKNKEAMLSPLRFHYDSDDFSLPVRLGLLNSRGMQDLIIHILAKDHRYEVANAKNVTIPTNLIVDKSVKNAFAPFYAALFDYTLKEHPGAVVTEYAWQASQCDPCPTGSLGGGQFGGALDSNDLQMFGMETFSPPLNMYTVNVSETSFVVSGVEPNHLHKLRRELALQAQRCAYDHFAYDDEELVQLQIRIKVAEAAPKLDVNVNVERSYGSDKGLSQCVKDYLESLSMLVVKGMVGGSDFSLTTGLLFSSKLVKRDRSKSRINWVLTRLHARYNAKTLKDDLVFAKADAIVGGRGTPEGPRGALNEQGAQRSGFNNFQARYAILYPWKNKLTCKAPARWRWGGPPNGEQWTAKPALDLASTPRKKVKLSSAIKSKDAPGLPWSKAK